MTQQSNPQDSSNLLDIRFIGPRLESQSIPIYELSRALEAIQRIINKAYIFSEWGTDRLLKGTVLGDVERQAVSLQMTEGKRVGQIGFIPFVTENPNAEILISLIETAITAVGLFGYGKEGSTEPNSGKISLKKGLLFAKSTLVEKREQFRKLVAKCFEGELKGLFFDLQPYLEDITYSDLKGGHSEQVLELISAMEKRGHELELIEYCKKNRPAFNNEWESFYQIYLENPSSSEQHKLQLLAAAIFNEVEIINRRIGNIGGIEQIEISSPVGENTYCLFNNETKNAIRSIRQEAVQGNTQELKGAITTLYLTTVTAMLQEITGNRVRLFLNLQDFNNIRARGEKYPEVVVTGHPIYRFGLETQQITEFDVTTLQFINLVDNGDEQAH
jgi:hypothetical protein